MADDVMVAPEGGAGLSEVARLVDAFVAPTKTFTDILRSATWWLPFIVLVVVTLGSTYAIDRNVGFDAVAEQQIEKNSFVADRINALPADQKAAAIHRQSVSTKITAYCSFIIILIAVAIEALVLWALFNFALGAKTQYGQVFAVCMYAGLPKVFLGILNIVLLFAGVGVENYDLQNPVGTNIGYYLTSPALKAAGGFFDIFGLWALFLLVIGMATISGKSKGQSAAVIVGLWAIGLIASTGIAAFMG